MHTRLTLGLIAATGLLAASACQRQSDREAMRPASGYQETTTTPPSSQRTPSGAQPGGTWGPTNPTGTGTGTGTGTSPAAGTGMGTGTGTGPGTTGSPGTGTGSSSDARGQGPVDSANPTAPRSSTSGSMNSSASHNQLGGEFGARDAAAGSGGGPGGGSRRPGGGGAGGVGGSGAGGSGGATMPR